MSPERRRQGRAIRKARRDARRAFESIDMTAVAESVDRLVESMSAMLSTVNRAAEVMVEFMSAILTAEFVDRVERHSRRVLRATTVVNQDC